MSVFDFIQSAGEKFESERSEALAAERAAAQAAIAQADAAEAAAAAAAAEAARLDAEYDALLVESLHDHVAGLGLQGDVQIAFTEGLVTLTGTAPDAETCERLVLAVGNVYGVVQVDDQLTVPDAPAAPAPVFYTVTKGDNLSKISSHFYGKGGLYRLIFEANKPMLKDANKIYVGQVLRIPAKPE